MLLEDTDEMIKFTRSDPVIWKLRLQIRPATAGPFLIPVTKLRQAGQLHPSLRAPKRAWFSSGRGIRVRNPTCIARESADRCCVTSTAKDSVAPYTREWISFLAFLKCEVIAPTTSPPRLFLFFKFKYACMRAISIKYEGFKKYPEKLTVTSQADGTVWCHRVPMIDTSHPLGCCWVAAKLDFQNSKTNNIIHHTLQRAA